MLRPVTWHDLWTVATERLGDPQQARFLVEAVAGTSGAAFLALLRTEVPPGVDEDLLARVARIERGEPLQYVMGEWSFRSVDLWVDPRVLIPRPETEQVVGAALDAITDRPNPVVVDLGTGSGAIALSVAVERKDAAVFAVERSDGAFDVASSNRERLAPADRERVTLLLGSWFEPLPQHLRGRVDLLISNPPYIAEDDALVESVVRSWEPSGALWSGADGLDDLRHLIAVAPEWLAPGGWLVVEIGWQQGEVVRELAAAAGLVEVAIGVDHADRDRWLSARMVADR